MYKAIRYIAKYRILLVAVLGFVVFFAGPSAYAASLVLSPASGSYAVRGSFSVSVYVSSPDKAVNAFSGDITYPSDKMSVVSISKAGSIVNFWTTEPTASNGVVHFEGVALNPGFTGASGKIITINFRAQAKGTANLSFSSSSVLANDGLGTSVLTTSGTARYDISGEAPSEPEPLPLPTTVGVPVAPVVTSVTHPDQNGWYASRVAELSWATPTDVTNVSYVTNANPDAVPSTVYGLQKGRSTPTLADGVWYTHVRLRNSHGWGPVTHFKTGIDATAPTAIDVKEVTGPDSAVKVLRFSATDALSGIAQFGVSLNGKPEVIVPASGAVTEYKTETLPRGAHSFTVKAYDRAGNFIPYTGSFEITKLESPVITQYQAELRDQDFLVIRGTSYPDTLVEFSLVRSRPVQENIFGTMVYVADGTPTIVSTRTDSKGNLVLAHTERLTYGLYKITARAVLSDSTKSDPSATIVIPVTRSLEARVIDSLLSPTTLVTVLFILFVLSLFLFLRTRRRYRELQLRTASLIRQSTERISG